MEDADYDCHVAKAVKPLGTCSVPYGLYGKCSFTRCYVHCQQIWCSAPPAAARAHRTARPPASIQDGAQQVDRAIGSALGGQVQLDDTLFPDHRKQVSGRLKV
jgi:hypothetical protein